MQEVIAQGKFEPQEAEEATASTAGSPNTAHADGNKFYVEVPKRCLADYMQRIAAGVVSKLTALDTSQLDEPTKKRHFAMVHSLVVCAEFVVASDIKFGFEIPIVGKPVDEELADICEVNNRLLETAAATLGYRETTEDASL